MKTAVVYSSKTGNTKMLADAIKDFLSESDCIYFGNADEKALEADKIYVGFWTDKGTCDEDSANFLKKLGNQQIFLFGTAGFGGSQEYYNQIIDRVKTIIPSSVNITGTFMCQGKMPMSVRQRYEKMLENPNAAPNVKSLIENFDNALSHPNEEDILNLKKNLK